MLRCLPRFDRPSILRTEFALFRNLDAPDRSAEQQPRSREARQRTDSGPPPAPARKKNDSERADQGSEQRAAEAQLNKFLHDERSAEIHRWLRATLPDHKLTVKCLELPQDAGAGEKQERIEVGLVGSTQSCTLVKVDRSLSRKELLLGVLDWLKDERRISEDEKQTSLSRLKHSARIEAVQAWVEAAGFPSRVRVRLAPHSTAEHETWEVSQADNSRNKVLVSLTGSPRDNKTAVLEQLLVAARRLGLVDEQQTAEIERSIVGR